MAKVGNKIKIRFGQQGAKTAGKYKKGESDRMKKRASFKARHRKNIARGKMSAAYWANKVNSNLVHPQRTEVRTLSLKERQTRLKEKYYEEVTLVYRGVKYTKGIGNKIWTYY